MIHKDAFLPLNLFASQSAVRKKAADFPFRLLIQDVLIFFFCFLIGRAVLFDEIAPFGTALFAVLLYRKKGGFRAFVAVTAGLFSFRFGGFAVKYVITMLLFASGWAFADKKSVKWTAFRAASLLFACLLLVNVTSSAIHGFLLYEILIGLLESIVGFVMVFILSQAADVLWDQTRRRILSNEEMICISIFFSLTIIGFWNVHLFGLSLRNIFSVFLILLFAYIGGAGAGAAIGITVGFLLSLASAPDPVLMGNLAICGLLAGTFRDLGRLGSGVAFLLANILMTFYINRSAFVILPFWEIAGAIALLMMIPKSGIRFLRRFVDYGWARADEQQYYGKRVQELTVGRLDEFAGVFHHLSKVFGRISERNSTEGKEELSRIFDQVADHVCRGCPLYRSCWERDFYNTYSNLFDLVAACEEKGYAEESDFPPVMLRKCLNSSELTEDLNVVYHTYRSSLNWQQRIFDCRRLVAEQLDGVSQVVKQLAAELDMDVRFRNNIEEALRLELDKSGIYAKEVLVLEKPRGATEISIVKPACHGGRECRKQVEGIVSRVMGKPMSCLSPECVRAGQEDCTLNLVEARRFEVVTGIARKPRQDSLTSGDSYSFAPVKDGKYLLALSDGMGSGARAAEESSAVVSLLENFLEAGFDQNITVKTINSILMLRSQEEMFATADVCIMDLVEGSADFIKIGGVPSFLRRENKVEIIRQDALPIGILEEVQLENISAPIQDEDRIVMVTDGILDAFAVMGDGERALADFIATLNTINPQEIADSVMEEALLQTDEVARDDMTVLVGRIWTPC